MDQSPPSVTSLSWGASSIKTLVITTCTFLVRLLFLLKSAANVSHPAWALSLLITLMDLLLLAHIVRSCIKANLELTPHIADCMLVVIIFFIPAFNASLVFVQGKKIDVFAHSILVSGIFPTINQPGPYSLIAGDNPHLPFLGLLLTSFCLYVMCLSCLLSLRSWIHSYSLHLLYITGGIHSLSEESIEGLFAQKL